jgi:hypothetical protein
VARPRPLVAMRPHLGVRLAQVPVPVAPVSPPGACVTGAARPSHVAYIAYPEVSAASAEWTAKAANMQALQASCDAARGAIRNLVATPRPRGSAAETIRPIRNLNVIGTTPSDHRSGRSDSRGAV